MHSPTIIYHATAGDVIITVTDVSGDMFLQVYTQRGHGRTSYEYGETWSTSGAAIKAAERLTALNKQAQTV